MSGHRLYRRTELRKRLIGVIWLLAVGWIADCVLPDSGLAGSTEQWQSDFESALSDHLKGKRGYPTEVHRRGRDLGDKQISTRREETKAIFQKLAPPPKKAAPQSGNAPLAGSDSPASAPKSKVRVPSSPSTESKPTTVIDGAQFPKELNY